MIKLQRLLRCRSLMQHLNSKPQPHRDIFDEIVGSKHFNHKCIRMSSSTINKDMQDGAEYFKNLTIQLHPDKNALDEQSEEQAIPLRKELSEPENQTIEYNLNTKYSFRNPNKHFSDRNLNTSKNINDIINDDDLTTFPMDDLDDVFNPLAKSEVKLDEIPTNFPQSLNLAAYVNKSTTLQQLVRLGVDLSKWDKERDVPDFVIKLDFEKDIQPYIQFLNDNGVPANELGKVLTKNPMIFQQPIDDLKVRINYLESKKFSTEAIARILTKAPYFIMFSTRQIDHRLGYFQKEFNLTGDELRSVVTRLPKLVLQSFRMITEKQFSFKVEMGFNKDEIKSLVINKPKLWLLEKRSLLERFQYLHNEIGISHSLLLNYPGALLHRQFDVKQRHLYLKALDRAQYDPTQESYISLKALVSGSDSDFCSEVTKTSVKKYNEFLKTL